MNRYFALVSCLVLLAAVSAGQAEVEPANIFADHMVLQRDMPVTVWGWRTRMMMAADRRSCRVTGQQLV